MKPSPFPALTIEEDAAVRIVTMNRPDALNAFDEGLHDAMRRVWGHLADDHEARAIVLTGAGKAFSAGGDLPWNQRNIDDAAYRRQTLRNTASLLDEMLRFPLPVVAAVQGPAVGMGCSIALLCDVVIMSETTFLSDPHVQVGLLAADGGTLAWPFHTSLLKAKEYLLTGDRIPADEAVRLGLVNRAVPQAQVLPEALALAQRFAALPAEAVQGTKRALNLHLQQAARTVLPFVFAAQSEAFVAGAFQESVARFTRKDPEGS